MRTAPRRACRARRASIPIAVAQQVGVADRVSVVPGSGSRVSDIYRNARARAVSTVLRSDTNSRRRNRARRSRSVAGGELDQIQFLLGHVSIQTTERYLGCKQKLRLP